MFVPAVPGQGTSVHNLHALKPALCQKEGITVSSCSSISAAPAVELPAVANQFRRRLAIYLVLTVLNAIVVANFIGTLYRATIRDALQQIGVTLLFAALVGSLTRMWFLTLKSRPR